jgi:histidinol-phosphatase
MARRWHAVRGEGAVAHDHLGERPIRVSTTDRLDEAQLVTSGIAPLEQAGFGPALSRLMARVWRDRGFGEFWGYMLVAEGAADAMLEIGPTLWDLAAPSLIVAEAGGRLTDFGGTPSYAGPQALATNGRLHDAIVDTLAGS